MVKELTGGDRIRARRMREDFWEFAPTHHIWLVGNHKPTVYGTDHGIWRRVKLIPFEVTIPDAEQDKKLLRKLKTELPGILNWAIEGCLLWQAEGLNAPASVTASITAYRSEMDTVAGFIEDECHQDPTQRSSVANLYEQYASWCKAQDKHPRTKVQFGTVLKSQGYAQVRDNTGRYWQGLTTFMVG